MIETQVWATLGPLLGCHTIPLTLQRLLESFSWKLENSGNHLNPSLVGIKLGAVLGGGGIKWLLLLQLVILLRKLKKKFGLKIKNNAFKKFTFRFGVMKIIIDSARARE